MTDTVLTLQGIRKQYGPAVAVAELDLSLARGEFLTFLGPSGSGKTTTLMMVAGLQRPDAGTIVLDGTPVDRLPPYRRDIGMVFQHYALFPHMTVARNVAFALEMRGVSRAQIGPRVSAMLATVGLPGLDARFPRQLSGGQQQRVALARAMIAQPALLLMDEPLGALDKALREQLQLEIKRLHRERRMSVLYVTHDQSEALTMSDRIAVFNRGRIEQVGTPAELYERPATRFVAGFVGETNFAEATLLGTEAGLARIALGGTTMQVANLQAGITAGSAVTLAIRPERVRLSAEGDGPPGTIVDVIYLGSTRRLLVRLEAGPEWSVLLGADQADAAAPAPGQRVHLSWHARHATAYPAGE